MHNKNQIKQRIYRMADERDRLIIKLKAEVEALSQHERDYSDLNFLLTNLEHRYNLLNEEKYRIEQEFALRNETNIQTIAMHRADIDQLREELAISQTNCNKLRKQIDEGMYHSQGLASEVQHLTSENHQLHKRVEYLQHQIQTTVTIREREDTTQQLKNELNKNKAQIEKLYSENRQCQTEVETLTQENRRLAAQLNSIAQDYEQHILDLRKAADEELQQQKSVLMKNNEHFQTTIENLTLQNNLLIKQANKPAPVKESDLNRQQLQETLKEVSLLKRQLLEKEDIERNLRNEKRQLQQQLELTGELLEETKTQLQFLKEELTSSETNRQSYNHKVLEMEREITILRQEAHLKDKSFETLRLTTQQDDQVKALKENFEVLEHEYQILQKLSQGDIARVRDMQFSLECKDRELNRTVKRISELECELRQRSKFSIENEQLKNYIEQQRIQLEQQNGQVRKIFEDGNLIKEYLNKKKSLRENRLNNERTVLQTINELINSK